MIQVITTEQRTLQPGQALTFDAVSAVRGCYECFTRQAPNIVTLTNRSGSIAYDVSFHANITNTAENTGMQLSIAFGGYPNASTSMNAVNPTANGLVNVSSELIINNFCQNLNKISIVNSGATEVIIASGASLIIKEV